MVFSGGGIIGERGAVVDTGDRLAALEGRYWGLSRLGAGWLRGAAGGGMTASSCLDCVGDKFLVEDDDARDESTTGEAGLGGDEGRVGGGEAV